MNCGRVGVAGFLHESNSFLDERTRYEHFASTSLTRGQAMRERWSAAAHELGGMLRGCDAAGLTAVPLYATFAVPSGPVAAEAFERIAEELTAALREAMPLDGLLIALHGATVAETHPDADGEMLARVRRVVGPDLPVVATFDLHANLSPRMAELASALIGYRSNPHLDQRERGEEAARLMARILGGEVRPAMAVEHPPMLLANSRQHTAVEPALGLYRDLDAVLAWPGILTASVAMGFPHADVAEVGASFVAIADGDTGLARRAAGWMAARAWDRRAEFLSALPLPAAAVQEAVDLSAKATPVVLLDTGDNVGGGSPGNSTVLYRELAELGAGGRLLILHDPAGVALCIAAGVGQPVKLVTGEPRIEIAGRVRLLADGVFEDTAVRHGGWTRGDQGVTAVIETAALDTIVLTSRRMAPFSLEQVLSLGIHPERHRILIVKGVVAPRAAYEPVAKAFVLAGTPGVTADDPRQLPYRHRRRPLFPLDSDARYPE